MNWKSFAHRDQQKTCLGYVALELRDMVTNVEFWFVDRFHCKLVASSPYLNSLKDD
jgi:hypothetical protein